MCVNVDILPLIVHSMATTLQGRCDSRVHLTLRIFISEGVCSECALDLSRSIDAVPRLVCRVNGCQGSSARSLLPGPLKRFFSTF